MRLQKMIALSTELSRRAAEKAIAEGKVTVGGRTITKQGTTVDPKVDKVCVFGRPLTLPAGFIYIAFHKPRGLLVTKKDTHGRPTIWDSLGKLGLQLNSAGRLDLNSEGLLILTNDGDLINALTHPRHSILKVYEVRVSGLPDDQAIKGLKGGVELSDGRTRPASVEILSKDDRGALLQIGIKEGKKRQVRRMMEKVGHRVLRLKRTAIGPIKLGAMKSGKWRYLTDNEIRALKNLD